MPLAPELDRVGFGTSGVRGRVADLDDPVCFAYAWAFVAYLKRNGLDRAGKVAVGLDRRPSSPRIAAACMQAVVREGLQFEFCGILPTPALALHAMANRMPAIMVTGSHIPFDRNGIKFYVPGGEILKTDEQEIRAGLADLPSDWGRAVASAELPATDPAALERYRARYLNVFPAALLRDWRVGVYQHSSVARDLLGDVVGKLGGTPVALDRRDDFVPLDTEAVDPDLERKLGAWTAEHRLDAIISTDGDADRPLIADEAGHLVRGDVIGILTARWLGAHTVVTPVSSNTALEVSRAFPHVVRTRIGSPYVIEAMRSAAATGPGPVVGFEANGGFLTETAVTVNGMSLSPLPTRDALLPILSVLSLARRSGLPLSTVGQSLPPRFTASGLLKDLSPQRMAELVALISDADRLIARLPVGPIGGINRLDGTRLTLIDGRIVHFRPSGNAPELRCYVETDDQGSAQTLVTQMLERLAAI